jgi:hypothetical protein
MKSSFFKTVFLLLALPFLVFAIKKVLDLRKGAAGTFADINIDTQSPQGSVPSSLWRNLAQGGEEAKDMIAPVSAQTRLLQPELIRLDHLFDYYQVYQGPGNYDFSKLDPVVNTVISTGAKPLLSISYTTAAMSKNGQNAGEPADWNQWYALVKATAKHYSKDKGISGIYYEVWNEPDLFGGWHYGKAPNYITLYSQTARAIQDGAAGTRFKIGGPATTAYYSNWIKALFAAAAQNNLRLDFISWHKYSKNIEDYLKEFNDLNSILSDYPQYFDVERLITEVGPNPEGDVWYDNKMSGVHLISLSTQLAGRIHRIFPFEIVDGPNPRAANNSGWGMITHPSNGAKIKERYNSVRFLNRLSGQRLATFGDGSWVTSLATKNQSTIQALLVNYDPANTHAETPPLTFSNLPNGDYQLSYSYYPGSYRKNTKKSVTVTDGNLKLYQEPALQLDPNVAVFVELTPQ